MGAVILGRYTRLRWLPAWSASIAELEQPDANSLTAAAQFHGAEEVWGLTPDQPVLLTGSGIISHAGQEQNRIAALPAQPVVTKTIALPQHGEWLVSIEHSGSMWAALRNVRDVEWDEISFDWSAVELPGSNKLIVGRPARGCQPFDLVAPPALGTALPALLDQDGALLTAPLRCEKGAGDHAPPEEPGQLLSFLDGICHQVTPCYRYGLLVHGVIRWLDIKPGVRPATATPITTLLRKRLAVFGRELAARGIYYEDDASETGYELRFAVEDGAVPPSFYEADAALAFTVSGEGAPEDDKREQARQLYDPEDDWETGQSYAIDYPAMPARVDVSGTDLVFYTSEFTTVDGMPVNDAWAEAHLEYAGLAAGLDVGASSYPALMTADRARVEGATGPLPLYGSTVDAADRVQRAAYAFATGGTPDAAVEARLARLRGPIVRVLLGRVALHVAKTGNLDEAVRIVATLPPLAPGPFPCRAHAVIELADGLVDQVRQAALVTSAIGEVIDPLEQHLALLFANRAGCAVHGISHEIAKWPVNGTVNIGRWGEEVLEPLFGSLEPPDGHPIE
jgi:hypothetical protein